MIPIFLAYVPALVIGFMIFTLLITRYEELPLEPPKGDWPEGWPPVTIVVAAWNESEAIVRTLERISELAYDGHAGGRLRRQQLDRRHRACAQTLRVIAWGSGTDVSSRRSRASTTR